MVSNRGLRGFLGLSTESEDFGTTFDTEVGVKAV